MKLFARSIAAALGGLLATAAIAGAMAATAQAQTYHSIIQKPGSTSSSTRLALKAWPSGAVTRNLFDDDGGVPPSQRWIRTETGSNFFTYENVKYPGQCLEVRSNVSGAPLMTGPCQTFLARQKWTQGFSTEPFRKLDNLETGYSATFELPPHSGDPSVVQRFDQGLDTQRWIVKETFRGPYAQ
jgi:hypothetical protein